MNTPTILITGSRTGIGRAGALLFARAGWHVVVHARSAAAGEVLLAELLGELGFAHGADSPFSLVTGDFADLQQVSDMADQVQAVCPRLQVLWNNAGIMTTECRSSAQGFELQWAVNYLGGFYLTQRLLPLLQGTGQARIINTSSFAHNWGKLAKEGSFSPVGRYKGFLTYGSTKLANVLHAMKLRELLKPSGGNAWAFHPGFVATNIGSNGNNHGGMNNWFMRLFMVEPQKGAATAQTLAISPANALADKLYWSENRPSKPGRLVTAEHAEDLWQLTTKVLGNNK